MISAEAVAKAKGRKEKPGPVPEGKETIDEDVLSAELLYSDAEVLAEFQAQCEAAAESPSNLHDLEQAAKALVRVLSRAPTTGEA
jgi:hypothetical protein